MELEALESLLRSLHSGARSGRQFVKAPDPNYGQVFQFDIVPCCAPIPCIAWFNPHTPGVFFRAFIAKAGPEAMPRIVPYIMQANADLPAGCFAIQKSDGQVVFKHASYFGELLMSKPLIEGVILPSKEFVSMHWAGIIEAISGVAGSAHKH